MKGEYLSNHIPEIVQFLWIKARAIIGFQTIAKIRAITQIHATTNEISKRKAEHTCKE
jgi:hypothetical protein